VIQIFYMNAKKQGRQRKNDFAMGAEDWRARCGVTVAQASFSWGRLLADLRYQRIALTVVLSAV
jgi:hypothetical protein